MRNDPVCRVGLLAAFALTFLAGCTKTGSDVEDAGAVTPAPQADAGGAAAAVVASNAGEIARFAAEIPVVDDDTRLVDPLTNVRTGPKQGGTVATLKAGADVKKIAEHQGAVLVTFADPKNASATLMGWVAKEAFTGTAAPTPAVVADAGPKDASADASPKDASVDAAPAAADAGLTCAAGLEAVVGLASAPVCRKKCVTDADCKAGTACSPATATSGRLVRICPKG